MILNDKSLVRTIDNEFKSLKTKASKVFLTIHGRTLTMEDLELAPFLK